MNAPAMLSFNFEGAELRGFEHDGEPWFLAQDACALLGYTNTSKALIKLDEDEKGITIRDTLGGRQQMLIVSESGLWCLIIRSRRQEAKRIRRWITEEVLPAIRKTGHYEMPGAVEAEDKPMGVSELERLRLHLATINTAHRIYGPKAARKVWEQLGFPAVQQDSKADALLYEIPDPDYDRFLIWLEERTERDTSSELSISQILVDLGNWWRNRYAYHFNQSRVSAWLQRVDPENIGIARNGRIVGIRLKD